MSELLDNPLLFKDKEHTAGKLRVFAPILVTDDSDPPIISTVEKSFAFNITIFEAQKEEMAVWGLESIPAEAVRPAFSWSEFAVKYATSASVNEALENWGEIIDHEWIQTIAEDSDKVVAVHVTDDVTLELHSAWCNVLGRVGYIKIIPAE